MACTIHPAESPVDEAPPLGRAMTRCECAGCAFSEVARTMRSEGLGVEEACRRTGCGQTCGACIPDLHVFLRAQGLQP